MCVCVCICVSVRFVCMSDQVIFFLYPSTYLFLLLLYIYFLSLCLSGPAVRVFANGPGDLGSIPGRVIPKTLKMILDTTLLNNSAL